MAEEQSQRLRGLILFDDLDLQLTEIDLINKIVPGKAGFPMNFELHNVLVQPDRLAEIKLEADFIQCPKNLVGTGVAGVIRNTGIPEHVIILKGSGP